MYFFVFIEENYNIHKDVVYIEIIEEVDEDNINVYNVVNIIFSVVINVKNEDIIIFNDLDNVGNAH